jgi:hypothetical protein
MAKRKNDQDDDYPFEVVQFPGHGGADSSKWQHDETRPENSRRVAIYLYYDERGWLVGKVSRYEWLHTDADGKQEQRKSLPKDHLLDPVDPATIPQLERLGIKRFGWIEYPIVFYPKTLDTIDQSEAIKAIDKLQWCKPAAALPVEREVLFNLPALMHAHKDTQIWFPEGEKDALTIIGLGGTAVASSGGADCYNIRYNQYFYGRPLIVPIDNDDSGKIRGEVVRAEINWLAKSVRVCLLAGAKDVTEWVEQHINVTLDQLKEAAFNKDHFIVPVTSNSDESLYHRINWLRIRHRKNEGWAGVAKKIRLPNLGYSTPNLNNALRMMGVVVRYNEFTDQIELSNTGSSTHDKALTDEAITHLKGRIALAFGFEVPWDHLWKAIAEQAKHHTYHPVRDWLNSLNSAAFKWDGDVRARNWVQTYMGAADTPLNRAIGWSTLLALVARILEPGYEYDILATFEGPQGIEKTKALRRLVGQKWYGAELNFKIISRTKEVLEVMGGVWLAEIGEMVGLKGAAQEHVKHFLSKTHDKARPAYAHVPIMVGRCWVPIGTTNPKQYLGPDPTGHRRHYPVEVAVEHEILIDKIEQDRAQIFAEVMVAWNKGERPGIPPELWEEARRQQAERVVDDLNLPTIEEWTNKLKGFVTTYTGAERIANPIKRKIDNADCEGWYVTYKQVREKLNLSEEETMRNSRYNQIIRTVMEDRLGWKRGRYDGRTTVFWRTNEDGQEEL